MHNRLLYFLFFALALASCRKDVDDLVIREVNYTPPVISVQGNLVGQVVGENGEPIAGASVVMGSLATTTNEAGLFRFRNATLNAGGTYVRVSRPGYFPGSDRFFPLPNANNVIRIGLIPRRIAGSVSATAGGVVALANGAKVELPANGIMDENGDAYTGTVEVAAHWLNPDAENLADIMPGNLQGVDLNDREVSMASFGMMAVELQSPDGRKLQVATGKRAKLTFPLPDAFRAEAPASIPLWYFDEALGLWVEEGEAELQNGTYVGEVAHFSFWNCDLPFPLVNITGTLTLNNGGPAAGQHIFATANNLNISASTVTNANGGFAGKVPKNEPLTFSIWTGCGLASISVGPFSQDTDLGTININTGELITSISGQLVDCSNAPITDGAVLITWSNNTYVITVDANGNFNGDITTCDGGDFSLTGFDFPNSLSSDAETFSFGGSVDAGAISVCDAPLTAYMIVDINGEAVNMIGIEMLTEEFDFDSSGVSHLFYGIRGTGATSDGFQREFTFWIKAPLAEEDYTGESLWVNGTDRRTGGGVNFYRVYYCPISCDNATLTLTDVGDVGEFVTGSVTGTLLYYDNNQQQSQLPVSANFSILRTE